VVFLVSTLFIGWYTISAMPVNSAGGKVSETFYPAGVGLTGSESNVPTGQLTSYTAELLPHVGALYAALYGLVVVGAILAFLAGLFVLVGMGRARPTVVLILSLLALSASVLGPALLVIEQPSAACADAQDFSPPLGAPPTNGSGASCTWEIYLGGGNWYSPGQGSSGPQSSFFGTVSQYGQTMNWGPGAGWYLALVGAGFIGMGTLISRGVSIRPVDVNIPRRTSEL
jgi:hypothetical protein